MMNGDVLNVLNVEGSFYQGTSNVRNLCKTYFSIKNRKFIRPVNRRGNSVSGYYTYNLLSGTYITFNFDYWTKANPYITFEIDIIKLVSTENSYKIDTLKSVKIRCDKKVEIVEIIKSLGITKFIEIIEDFISILPTYHIGPDIKKLSSKIYDEETVNELLNFVDKFNGQTLFHQMEID